MNLDVAKELADAHWSYIEKLLEAHEVDRDIIKASRYHYITAFVHGYKHAIEEDGGHVSYPPYQRLRDDPNKVIGPAFYHITRPLVNQDWGEDTQITSRQSIENIKAGGTD